MRLEWYDRIWQEMTDRSFFFRGVSSMCLLLVCHHPYRMFGIFSFKRTLDYSIVFDSNVLEYTWAWETVANEQISYDFIPAILKYIEHHWMYFHLIPWMTGCLEYPIWYLLLAASPRSSPPWSFQKSPSASSAKRSANAGGAPSLALWYIEYHMLHNMVYNGI